MDSDSSKDRTGRRLAGRRILITGAASGMGEAIARRFVREGAKVALFDSNRERLASVAAAVDGFSAALDVSDEKAVAKGVADASAAMGGIDGVVNAAGIRHAAPLTEIDLASWQHVLAVNLTGPFLVCRATAPYLRAATPATIVNISSGAVLIPFSNISAYAASKGGVYALSKTLAMELAPAIRVNSICPGHIDTPMIRTATTTEADMAARAAQSALRQVGSPTDIADAVLFLTSAESKFMTGACLSVDGGRTYH